MPTSTKTTPTGSGSSSTGNVTVNGVTYTPQQYQALQAVVGATNPNPVQVVSDVATAPFKPFLNLPIFKLGFWYRFGVGALGVLFIWWAILIFIAQSKTAKTAVNIAANSLVPEGRISKAATTRAGSTVTGQITNKL